MRAALREAGFSETTDRLRTIGAGERQRPVAPDPLGVRELDTERFLEEHTKQLDGGLREADLVLDGVHCAACVWLVERLPSEMEGVAEARLDLPRGRVRLRFDPEAAPLSEVAGWLARFGYALRPTRGNEGRQRTDAERALLIRLGVTWALAGNVMLLAFALYSGLADAGGPLAAAAKWASLALAVPAVVYGGAPFFQRAWASMGLAWRARDVRRLHLDTPIALGILVGLGHSAWATISGTGDVWFDSVTVLIAALLTARYIQLRSRRLAGDATERLLALLPAMARRVTSPEAQPGDAASCEAVRLDELRRGDIVEVAPGETIPADGVVARGESRVDNAVLTGESRPVPVAPEANVAAGATNLTAPLHVRVEAVGEDSRVGTLLAWVREADTGRAPVVLWADRLGGVFVLAVLGLAILTAAVWAVLDAGQIGLHVAALLVITCPCALGMATPLAFAVAGGRAARAGIFVKSDAATQALTEIDTVVLDKTGTLTEGAMRVVDHVGDAEALALSAALEAHVAHPLATAIAHAFALAPEAVTRVQAENGAGVRGTVDDREVQVGRPDWVASGCGAAPEPLASALRMAVAEGFTPVAVAVDGLWRAVLAIGDGLRIDVPDVIGAFRARGLDLHILSGDHPETVAHLARGLGIPAARAHGGIAPEAKRDRVRELQAAGRRVMVVGDGVNDAAALRQADVGVAVGGGSTASLVAADVFLTRAGLAPVLAAMDAGRTAVRTVRRALALSLGYNLLGACAAIAGLVTPLVAAIAMPVSSLLVVGIALSQRAPSRSPEGSGGAPLPFRSPTPSTP
ncbi:heavy metal translocating P-type ATPase [Rubricoccus marinus]|uniref:Copper-translocating P-type ATPase n=1 Tax=Rubricoccus marinus TaxID=716817 RepID=A0A259TXY5_9BACT|nr:cation-translocating P-type ATPase [Rubricoccus marinus]OZC02438.1 copper-translocating P-type ATPase [Rubricoccus marinus]